MRRKTKHRLPFLFLLFIHSLLIFYTFYRSKDRRNLLLLLISNIGLAYLFEYFVLNLFQAYVYKPKFLKNKELDNILGAILSQAIFVPFTSTFLTSINSSWLLKLIFTLYFFMIEKFFLILNIYRTNWWRPAYTFVFIPLYFNISDKWYSLLQNRNSSILFFSLYFSILVNGVNILYLLALTRKFKFGMGRWHSWREHFIYAPLYSISLSLISTFIFSKSESSAKTKVIMMASIVDFLLYRLKLVKTKLTIIFTNVFIHFIMSVIGQKFKNVIYQNKAVSKL